MKFFYIMLFSIPMFLFISCSQKDDTKLIAQNPEAFAFNIEGGWEINASVRVKGFQQNNKDDIYSANLSYQANLLSMDGKVLKSNSDELNEEGKEELIDLPVETQFEVDSTYSAGMYKVQFIIKDKSTNKEARAEKEVELQKE